VQDCQVCGRSFDPSSFQVVVPELGRGFDRVECARSARALGLSGGAVAAAPLVAIVEPFTAAALPAVAAVPSGLRPAAMPVATFGLIAVGAAAAAFLWLRVLGPETTAFHFPRAAAPPAFAHESVQAHVQPSSTHSATRAAALKPSRRPVTVSTTAILASSPLSSSPGPVHRSPTSAHVTRPAPRPSPQPDQTGERRHKHGKHHHKHGWKADGQSHEMGDHGHEGKHGGHHEGKHGGHKGKGKDEKD
jgi:hypothetical protein